MSAVGMSAWLRMAVAGLATAASALALHTWAQPAAGPGAGAGHVRAELVADHLGVSPGGRIQLALRQVIEPGWHTYWRNPGDSGEATTLTFALPPGWIAGPLAWPAPTPLRIGPLMDYGYSGEVLLPAPLAAPATARPGQVVAIKAHAGFLVCKDVCVPEDVTLSLDLPVTAAAPAGDPRWGPRIAAVMAALPRTDGLRAAVTPGPGTLKLSVVGPSVKDVDVSAAYFFPYDGAVIDHAQAQAIERGPDGLTLTLARAAVAKSAAPPAGLAGVLSLGGKAYEIDASAGPPLAGAFGLGPPAARQSAAARLGKLGLAAGLALLGGLILNLMPCVFPVLAMKAAALSRHAHEPRAARAQGLAYMAGVIATFLGLAAALIAARAAGEAVGWGFQLQTPAVVAGLSLVMLLVALDLSGVFEIGGGLQALAGRPAAGDGAAGALLTGVLAVVVAAPCTAPFMAGAIGFALTQSPAAALTIFFALGMGMAAPFTLLAFAPGLLACAPRPGPWMDGLKKALAFPMYAAAAWLVWVFSQQTGAAGQARLLAAAVLTGLAAWLYGAAQRARTSGGRSWGVLAVAAVAFGLAVGAAFWPGEDVGARPASASTGELVSEPFSPGRLAALRAQGRPVFVNFTAAWCVTCQVNERVALSSRRLAEAFRRAGVVYLKGDWTNRDAVIAGALAEHGRAGVPLYLMYGPGGGEPVVLPQILTEGLVEDAVRKAGASDGAV
jgi:thiol:disulfide interchange protein DsbD